MWVGVVRQLSDANFSVPKSSRPSPSVAEIRSIIVHPA
jgi:hypothetical protein